MLNNYFKIAWRNLLRNRTSSFINISGLAVGMAVALLTGLWLHDELSFNKYHAHYDRIAKVSINGVSPDGPWMGSTLSYPLVQELKTHYSDDFQHLVRASWVDECILSSGDKKVSGVGQYMDEEAPDLFSLKMVRGSRVGLHDMHSILLSASIARTLFGEADPTGQLIYINKDINVKVTGVYEDLPLNTDLHQLQYISTWSLWISNNNWVLQNPSHEWFNHFLKLYAEIKPGATFATVDARIRNVEMDAIRHFTDENHQHELAVNPKIVLDPMKDWHLGDGDHFRRAGTSPKQMVWMVTLIGVFVLLLACINFMNLATARSERRAHEVGIRKVIGSMRRQLIIQFFCESLAMVAFSFLLALGLTVASLHWFNQLAAKEMQLPWASVGFWGVGALFIFITGLIAGSYPALFLSSFKPLTALKGTFRPGRQAAIPRKVLVVFQFTLSVALINCTIVVLRQVDHARERPVGYDREGLIMMKIKTDELSGKYDLIRNELLHTGMVANFAESMGKVTELWSNNGGFDWPGRDAKNDPNFGTLAISADYGRTIGWQFIQGRDFSREMAGDSLGIVINESAMKVMGLKDVIGTDVTWTWWMERTKVLHYKIIGVVKDMVMQSPYGNTQPTVFYQKGLNGGTNFALIKVKPGVAMHRALPAIGAVMKKLAPAAPFDYQFADAEFALKFAAEERISKLAGFFAVLAIFISSLGLLGLASFTAEQRTKEVGIRKVLGASVMHLWGLLSREFVYLVVVSLMIAGPVAYWFMHQWLQSYAYRTGISWWIFAASGMAAIVITLVTVSFQAMRAAMMNPVKSLRAE